MKFKYKIFLLCISVYILTLIITTVSVSEKNYSVLLGNEVQRCIKEESSIKSNINLYLLTNRKLNKERLDISTYSSSIIDMYGSEETYLELYNTNLHLLSSNSTNKFNVKREELGQALSEGKNYILRNINDKQYIFITDTIEVENSTSIMAFIKDISFVKKQRAQQYQFFIQFGFIGLIIVGALVIFIGKMVIRPIEGLTLAAINISSGNYKERVEVAGRDEVGMLAKQFNLMADEVQKKVEDLKLEGERKQRFIDNLTHELRTPLTSIIGYSDLLLTVKFEEDMFKKSLGYINSEGKRMMNMVSTLMELILTREKKIAMERVSSGEIFEEVINVISVKAANKKVKLIIEGEDLQFFVNKDLIKEALLNIVDNALNASDAGKKIILGTGGEGKHLYMYIQDEGKGISEEHIEKITEPFYRVDKSRARKEGGMGLGMSIVSEIISMHNGVLKIESELGKGTRMMIVF